jgi:hypothetical protein
MTVITSLAVKSARATQFPTSEAAFQAWIDVCADFPDYSFRIRSGSEPGTYRLEAFGVKGFSRWVDTSA